MMTSSNGNIFRVTGHLCGEFTGPVTGEFPTQRPATRSFDVLFDRRLNKWLSKQSWGWWFETLSRPLWRHCNDTHSRTVATADQRGGVIPGHQPSQVITSLSNQNAWWLLFVCFFVLFVCLFVFFVFFLWFFFGGGVLFFGFFLGFFWGGVLGGGGGGGLLGVFSGVFIYIIQLRTERSMRIWGNHREVWSRYDINVIQYIQYTPSYTLNEPFLIRLEQSFSNSE